MIIGGGFRVEPVAGLGFNTQQGSVSTLRSNQPLAASAFDGLNV